MNVFIQPLREWNLRFTASESFRATDQRLTSSAAKSKARNEQHFLLSECMRLLYVTTSTLYLSFDQAKPESWILTILSSINHHGIVGIEKVFLILEVRAELV